MFFVVYTHGRSILLMRGRVCLLCILTTSLGGVWILEQPHGSVVEFHPAWRRLCASLFAVDGVGSVSTLARYVIYSPSWLFIKDIIDLQCM